MNKKAPIFKHLVVIYRRNPLAALAFLPALTCVGSTPEVDAPCTEKCSDGRVGFLLKSDRRLRVVISEGALCIESGIIGKHCLAHRGCCDVPVWPFLVQATGKQHPIGPKLPTRDPKLPVRVLVLLQVDAFQEESFIFE